jgi:hypothetical protein
MPYALIVNKEVQFEKLESLNNFSIFKMVLFELIKFSKDFYIVAKSNFYQKILQELNDINFLVNNNVHLLTYETELDNHQKSFLLTNLIFSEIRLIPLDDYDFDKDFKHIKKFNLKVKKKIYWSHPVYVLKSSNYRSQFLLKKKYKFCLIEYFIKHRKKELNLFFNKIINDYNKYDINDLNIDMLNKIKKYPNFNLNTYFFK